MLNLSRVYQESVDTPLVERKKNGWFQRQITRVGSVRSSSTTYSSGGGFLSRNRHNSVYSSPETGGLPQTNNPNLKISLYDRFVGRKSVRSQRMGRQGVYVKKLNRKIFFCISRTVR